MLFVIMGIAACLAIGTAAAGTFGPGAGFVAIIVTAFIVILCLVIRILAESNRGRAGETQETINGLIAALNNQSNNHRDNINRAFDTMSNMHRESLGALRDSQTESIAALNSAWLKVTEVTATQAQINKHLSSGARWKEIGGHKLLQLPDKRYFDVKIVEPESVREV